MILNDDVLGLWLTRETHWYVIGVSQSGKTTLLKNVMLQDMGEEGHNGLCFIDLHGDCSNQLLGLIPKERIQDVIFFDPTLPYCPAFNFLKLPYDPGMIVGDLISLFKEFSAGSWGPRLDQILTNALTTTVFDIRDNKTSRTLRDVKRLLLDQEFRNGIIEAIRQPDVREFWDYEFENLKSYVNPVTNKLDKFLSPASKLTGIFSQPDNDLDFYEIMNTGKILICRLPKGELGEEEACTLGSIIVRGIQQAAMARSKIPEEQRKPFFLVVDECQNLVSSPFDAIMNETSKFATYLTLAHHDLGQLTPRMRSTVFNCKIYVTFHIHGDDAPRFQREMHRVDTFYRIRGTSDLLPVDELIDDVRSGLQEAFQYYKELAERDNQTNPWYRFVSNDIKFSLDVVSQDYVSVEALKDIVCREFGKDQRRYDKRFSPEFAGIRLFADMEFIERVFPTVEDFVNLPDHKAFCRAFRASNVFSIDTEPPPLEDHSTRQEILSRHQQRQNERTQYEQLATEHQQPTPPPTERPKKKKPKDDEDFLN